MSLKIKSMSGVTEKGKLNTEWLLVENMSDRPFNTEGCSITVSKRGKARPKVVTTIKAGLVIQAGETCRLISGSSGRSSHGQAPDEEGIRNVYLYMKAPYLDKSGLRVKLMNRQQEICSEVYQSTDNKAE